MEPTYRENDIIFAVSYLGRVPKVRDVVISKNEGNFIIKRVGKIDGSRFYLLGDNSKDSLDSRKTGWVERKNIFGKVLFKI